MKSGIKLLVPLLILAVPAITVGQDGLLGLWKYVSPGGEMTIQIGHSTIVIDSQPFTYKTQGNILMINEGNKTTPYPYMLDGNQLTMEFPGGIEVVFTRSSVGALPQSMSKPSSGMGQEQKPSTLSGKWLFQNQQGQLILEFLSDNQLAFNGETIQYQLNEGVIQVLGDYGWIDYPYTLSQGTLTLTFPDGNQYPFSRTISASADQEKMTQQELNQPGTSNQKKGEGSTWQLKGALCSWSGSSNSTSSYSRTQKIVFDGQGNFQFGSEGSFSSGGDLAYSGNPSVKTGTYSIGERTVTLYYHDGDRYEFKINMRQDNGMITELMYSGNLYAKGLCE